MAAFRTVSSLDEIDLIMTEMNVQTMNQTSPVRLRLHQQAAIEESVKIKERTYPGKRGCKLLNNELLNTKFHAHVCLKDMFQALVGASMAQCDQQLRPVEEHIAALQHQILTPDNQIQLHGPPVAESGRGVQHVVKPNPPFPLYPSYEFGNTVYTRPAYDEAYATEAERDAALARDRQAQRAVWAANLRLLQVKKSVQERYKAELEKALSSEFEKMMREKSDLGMGYADYTFPHLT